MRLLRHVMGNDTIAITTVLCAFMGGLALGSYVGGRVIDRRGHQALLLFAILEGTIGLYCLVLPFLIRLTEPIYGLIYNHMQTSPYVFSLIRFFFCGLLLLVPATFMGATLPVLTRFFVRSLQQVGWPVGMLYGINTFGAVVGTAATGFLLIPKLGVQKTIYVGCLLNFAVCVAGLALFRRTRTWAGEDAKTVEAGTGGGGRGRRLSDHLMAQTRPPLVSAGRCLWRCWWAMGCPDSRHWSTRSPGRALFR